MRYPEKTVRLLCVHGPNLNLLGIREPGIYGSRTLGELNREIRLFAASRGVKCRFYQSNHEGRIIDFIHAHFREADGMVINPGALTHTSYSLRDAISGTALPTVEVHLSDIHQRESFRRISVIRPVCIKQISGYGEKSYFKGIDVLVERLKKTIA
jgi:3-dehydroquinate dehydratase-2